MLKTPFTPYSEKLRQSTERRRTVSNKTNLQIGDHAPDFTLYNTNDEPISLNNLIQQSNVVLLFFPLAFTDVCTDELCSIRDNMNTYSRLNAIVIGISVDSMFALKKFKEDKQLEFDLLSDFNKDIGRKFHVLYEEFPLFNMKGVTKRAAFVIDQKGIIQHIDILDDPGKIPDFGIIQEVLNKCNEE
jgi:peroxiredoxin